MLQDPLSRCPGGRVRRSLQERKLSVGLALTAACDRAGLVTALAVAVVGLIAFPSRGETSASGIRHLEPVIVDEGGAMGSSGERSLSFSAFGRRFVLDLEPSQVLRRKAKTHWVGARPLAQLPQLARRRNEFRPRPRRKFLKSLAVASRKRV